MKEEALKLADKAESMAIEIPADWSSGEPKNAMTDIADMIRKLVAENDNLFKALIAEQEHNEMLVAELEEKEYRVKELTKRYAALDRPEQQKETYFCKVCNRHLEIDDGVIVHDDIVHPDDMVFTPQTKPLSDDELMHILERIEYISGEVELSYDYEVRIARAIEERHGIK